MISSCAESFEKKAELDAILFTSKQCPKMVDNSGVILDSVVFNSDSFTRTEFYTLTGPSDDGLEQADYVDEFYQELIETIKQSVDFKTYKEKQVIFRFVYTSSSNPENQIDISITPGDYN